MKPDKIDVFMSIGVIVGRLLAVVLAVLGVFGDDVPNLLFAIFLLMAARVWERNLENELAAKRRKRDAYGRFGQ